MLGVSALNTLLHHIATKPSTVTLLALGLLIHNDLQIGRIQSTGDTVTFNGDSNY